MKLQIKYINDKRAFAHCPNHEDKNPSFEITLQGEYTGHYFCHSCGVSGELTKPILHQILSRKVKGKDDHRTNPINWKELSDKYVNDYFWMKQKDKPFDVDFYYLTLISCGWDGEAFTFPMVNSEEEIIGIPRRFPDGFKCMVEGSRLGLIIPKINYAISQPLFICEGISDTATVLDMGYSAIGRPNNDACLDMVKEWIIKHFCYIDVMPPELITTNGPIYVIADNDSPGIKGANQLSELLELSQHHIIYPMGGKDIRDSVKNHGKEQIQKWLKEQIL